MEFYSFDAEYVQGLCEGNPRNEAHFVSYFTTLLQLKLRARLQSPQAIEDVRQETFARVLATLRKGGALRSPDRLGAFVNTVCNNVLLEHYRASARHGALDESDEAALVSDDPSVLDEVLSGQLKSQVHSTLQSMPPRDRALLKAVFIDERNREEVSREFGVDSDYLRVLLFRAKQSFKSEFLKQIPTGFSTISR